MAANLQYAGPMRHLMLFLACCFMAAPTMAQPYTATREGEAVKLAGSGVTAYADTVVATA